MWSVRMRASKFIKDFSVHISGAEGIYETREIEKTLKNFLKRALFHSKGEPDSVVLTIEKITEPILKIKALPVKTIFCKSSEEAYRIVVEKLLESGVSLKAISEAWNIIKNFKLRGASLIEAETGQRLEPDKQKGVRVSRIHMDKKRKIQVIKRVRNLTSEPQRVVEALTIASKVSFRTEVLAELCVSDNPDYTTGYVASKKFGYLRITNIKNLGESYGGRAFFVKTPLNLEELVYFLEKTPVIVI
ncbi:MAG: 6-carboxyhexanoate--CoA ligase [Thermodesulfovibrionaceae bacterium]